MDPGFSSNFLPSSVKLTVKPLNDLSSFAFSPLALQRMVVSSIHNADMEEEGRRAGCEAIGSRGDVDTDYSGCIAAPDTGTAIY
jgi:hypothetical protein